MILVTVGNAILPFDRLLNGVDRLAQKGFFKNEPVVIQTGHHSTFRSTYCLTLPFLSMEDFNRKMTEASLIITHGGCTVLQALRMRKMPVVMPRRKCYGEHVNDHQLHFVEALSAERRIVAALEPENLQEAIQQARRQEKYTAELPPSQIRQLVAESLSELLRGGTTA